jgi:hypothetical protein
MRHITLWALLTLMLVALPAFARFSQFVCISPDNADPQNRIQPVITFSSSTQDHVTIQVPIIEGSRQYWLIVCKEPLIAEKQNFRKMVQQTAEKREDVVLVAPLTADRGVPTEAGITTNGTSITIQMSLELAGRAYIYVDYPHIVMDGGYFWAIDIPRFVKRLQTKPNKASEAIGASAPQPQR